MKIDNRFVIFKTLAGYKNAQLRGKVMDDSIVFVIENRGIYTHGILFGIDAHNKGFVGSVDKLPAGEPGDCATVKEGNKWFFYYYDATRGWVKGQECTIPDISQDTLDQYLKKVNIREYLHHEYDNTYVRRDEVYTPDQEDWINPDDSNRDEWQWDEDGNLYRIDAELSDTSRNSVQNRVITNELHSTDTRMSTVEQLATISLDGGEAQIAAASDFTYNDASHRAKIPTVGAIKDLTYSKAEVDALIEALRQELQPNSTSAV